VRTKYTFQAKLDRPAGKREVFLFWLLFSFSVDIKKKKVTSQLNNKSTNFYKTHFAQTTQADAESAEMRNFRREYNDSDVVSFC
jgi:hypothetical protein